MPRRIYTYTPELGVTRYNEASTYGTVFLVIGFLIFMYNVWRTRKHGEIAGNDPWNGATLEWAIPSPPPVYNFSVIPTVSSRLPKWTPNGMTPVPDIPPKPVHVPDGSHWPPVAALGIAILATGALLHTLAVVLVGVAVLAFGIYRWAFEPFEV